MSVKQIKQIIAPTVPMWSIHADGIERGRFNLFPVVALALITEESEWPNDPNYTYVQPLTFDALRGCEQLWEIKDASCIGFTTNERLSRDDVFWTLRAEQHFDSVARTEVAVEVAVS